MMASEAKHTSGPWEIEARGGHELTGVEAEIAEMEDCEAYALRELKIVAPSLPTKSMRRNKETGKFDIPVPSTICEIIYDPRNSDADRHEADAALISKAPEMIAEMKAAAGYLRNAKIDLGTGATKATAIRTIEGGLNRLEAAIARAEGRDDA